jgi:hypothetical protein
MKLHNADLAPSNEINSVLARDKLNKERDYASAHPTKRTFKTISKSAPKINIFKSRNLGNSDDVLDISSLLDLSLTEH